MEYNNSNPNENSHSELKTLIENYKNIKVRNDTKSVWFSAAEIQELLAQDNVNGIRVYFARHHATHSQYPNRETVLLVPTANQTNPQKPSTENT